MNKYRTTKMGFINPFGLWHGTFSIFPFGLVNRYTFAIQLPTVFYKKWATPMADQIYFQFLYFYVVVLTMKKVRNGSV